MQMMRRGRSMLASCGLVLAAVAWPAMAQEGRGCSIYAPCPEGMSCHPFVGRCYHEPRRLDEPCMAGFECGAGLSCPAVAQRCEVARPGPSPADQAVAKVGGGLESAASTTGSAINSAAQAVGSLFTGGGKGGGSSSSQQGVPRDPYVDNSKVEAQLRAERDAEQRAQIEATRQAQAEEEQRVQLEEQQRLQAEAQRAQDAALAAKAGDAHRFEALSLRWFAAPDQYVRHRDFLAYVTPLASELDRRDATFRITQGLVGHCISFEAVGFPNHFLRHQGFRVKLAPFEDTQLFREDATFCSGPGLADGLARSYLSVNYPTYYLRVDNGELWLRPFEESDAFRRDATFVEGDLLQ